MPPTSLLRAKRVTATVGYMSMESMTPLTQSASDALEFYAAAGADTGYW